MTPTLLVNENFPVPALKRLRQAGLAVEAVQEVMPGASDVDVMAYARARAHWLVTFDRDYGELVFRRGEASPPAIIYLRQEPYPPASAADVLLALFSGPTSALGHFVTVSSQSVRMRLLP